MQLNFEAIFKDYMKNNKRVWAHDRSKTFGASETFACIRRGWFGKWGADAGFVQDEDDQSWGATERGNIIENHFVVPAISRHVPKGTTLLFAGDEQQTFIDDKSSATPDGLIVGLTRDALKQYGIEDIKSDCVGLEIKSIDPRVSLDQEKVIHHGQAQMQMGIVRATTDYRPYYTVILYIDASFLDVIYPFVVEFDEMKFKAGKTRARILFEVGPDGYPGDLKPEGKLSGECQYCPWYGACSAVTIGGMPKDDSTNNVDLVMLSEAEDLILRERSAKELRDDAEGVHKAITLEIKNFLTHVGKRKLRSPPKKKGSNERSWTISWSALDGKKTFDKDAAQADGVDVEKYEKTGNPYDRLTITVK